MRYFLRFLKGIIMGIALIIPGVSGGSLAVAMGIYDQLIDMVTVTNVSKKSFVTLLPFMGGVAVGIALFALFIEYMFERFPLHTAFLFAGMILGALPMLFKQVKGEPVRISHVSLLIGMMLLLILLPIASNQAGISRALDPTPMHAIIAFVLGVVGATTMVVPGVSGSMLLMLLGYYKPLLQYVNLFTRSLVQWDIASVLSSCVILVPLGIGMIFGIVVTARIIKWLLKKYPCATYYAIIGLVAASPVAVLTSQSFEGFSFGTGLVCLLLCVAGFFIASLLGKGEKGEF